MVDGRRQLTNKRKHIDVGAGTPDGMRCDVDGNLWMGWGMGDAELDGVVIYNPDGKLIGRITSRSAAPTSASAAPSATGCSWREQVVYSLYVNTQGALGG